MCIRDRVSANKPDLILMDIVIKGDIDGIETAAELNKTESIPVIYLTALSLIHIYVYKRQVHIQCSTYCKGYNKE